MSRHPAEFELGHDTAPDPRLQEEIEKLDARLRQKFGTDAAQTAAGVLAAGSAAGAGPARIGGFYACMAVARKAGYQIVQ